MSFFFTLIDIQFSTRRRKTLKEPSVLRRRGASRAYSTSSSAMTERPRDACASAILRGWVTLRLNFRLTLSPPIPLRLYTLPEWPNPPFLIFDIRALWRSVLSARAPECQKLKNGGLDQYDDEPFEQQQFETAGVEGVKGLHFTPISMHRIRRSVSAEPVKRHPSASVTVLGLKQRSRVTSGYSLESFELEQVEISLGRVETVGPEVLE